MAVVIRRLLIVPLVMAGLIGSALPASAGVPPPGCVVQPGRFTVTPTASHTIMLATLAVNCATGYNITDTVTSMRYWVSTRTWVPERTRLEDQEYGFGTVPAVTYAFYCNTPGAIMGDRIVYTYTRYDFSQSPPPLVPVSQVVYRQFNTAICPR